MSKKPTKKDTNEYLAEEDLLYDAPETEEGESETSATSKSSGTMVLTVFLCIFLPIAGFVAGIQYMNVSVIPDRIVTAVQPLDQTVRQLEQDKIERETAITTLQQELAEKKNLTLVPVAAFSTSSPRFYLLKNNPHPLGGELVSFSRLQTQAGELLDVANQERVLPSAEVFLSSPQGLRYVGGVEGDCSIQLEDERVEFTMTLSDEEEIVEVILCEYTGRQTAYILTETPQSVQVYRNQRDAQDEFEETKEVITITTDETKPDVN